MNKIAILYHKSDLDGVLSGVIACSKLSMNPQNDITLIPSEYGDNFKIKQLEKFDKIYILDFSDEWILTNDLLRNKIIWIDHHISAIKKEYKVNQFCINGVAACRLTYQYFYNENYSFLNDINFHNRLVDEPYFVTLAGEYDIWDKESPDAKYLNFGISDISFQKIEQIWENVRFINVKVKKGNDRALIEHNKNIHGWNLLHLYMERGVGAVEYIQSTQFRSKAVKVSLFGKYGWAYNTHIRSSLISDQRDSFTMVWNYEGEDKVKVSLYSESIDVSEIVKHFGGGGHRGAAGFQCNLVVLTKLLTVGIP